MEGDPQYEVETVEKELPPPVVVGPGGDDLHDGASEHFSPPGWFGWLILIVLFAVIGIASGLITVFLVNLSGSGS